MTLSACSSAQDQGATASDSTAPSESVTANLRGQRLYDVPLTDLGQSTPRLDGDYGRLRDVVIAPDGSLWVLTNNTDGRGTPGPDDDKVLRIG